MVANSQPGNRGMPGLLNGLVVVFNRCRKDRLVAGQVLIVRHWRQSGNVPERIKKRPVTGAFLFS